MSIRKYLAAEPLHELAKYSSHTNYEKDNVAFTGTPKVHPYDRDKVLLISDPFSTHLFFYEFRINDIMHVEELPRIAGESGESLSMIKIWVKKGSFGVRCEPFLVEDTLSRLKDGFFNTPQKEKE